MKKKEEEEKEKEEKKTNPKGKHSTEMIFLVVILLAYLNSVTKLSPGTLENPTQSSFGKLT